MNSYVYSNHPDVVEHVEALRDEILEREKKGEASIALDNVAFHTVMMAHSRYGDPGRAEAMLDEICQEALVKGSENPFGLILDSRSLVMVLRAWTNIRNPERAEAILKRMCQYRDQNVPNIMPLPLNFLSVVSCWNQSTDPLAGERADDLLQMLERENQGEEKVPVRKGFYLATMKNLARVGNGERAEAMLRRVQSQFEAEKPDTDVDLFLYREVIHAWSQSQDPNATDRIQSLETEIAERFPAHMAAAS